jgi:uncharacterized protein YbbK (DUF523 family)/uncharacterized protein YbgA (DUF1722 family)
VTRGEAFGALPADLRLPRIGVSSCLLGHEVRFDGGHKRNDFLLSEFAPYVEFVPVCPEVELGLGVPRPTLRLVESDACMHLQEAKSGRDHTEAMRRYAKRRVAALAALDLGGYVLKNRSPSCGMERVKVYAAGRAARRSGRGVFAETLLEALPSLPIEEEGRLQDRALRDNFIERVFAYRRLRALFAGRWRARDVVAFHTAHKLQLMAHSPEAYRALGRRVAGVQRAPRSAFRAAYEREFMAALARRATPGRATNVLQHMAGHLRARLDDASRRELTELICAFRAGSAPLVAPLILLRHHARHHGVDYLLAQTCLHPDAEELMLRNHA